VTSSAQHTPRGTTWRAAKGLVLRGFWGVGPWHADCSRSTDARSVAAFVASLAQALARHCARCRARASRRGAGSRGRVRERPRLRVRLCVRNRGHVVGIDRHGRSRRNHGRNAGWLWLRCRRGSGNWWHRLRRLIVDRRGSSHGRNRWDTTHHMRQRVLRSTGRITRDLCARLRLHDGVHDCGVHR
jgi:hypothetical protein